MSTDDARVSRLVMCTGKIFYDLAGHPERPQHAGLAIARLELLYPFPERQILELMGRYPNLREVVWVLPGLLYLAACGLVSRGRAAPVRVDLRAAGGSWA